MTKAPLIDARQLPLLVTMGLFAAMFAFGSASFPGFFTLQNFLNLFIDNAYLLILGVGMTFVIVSGGIDLSVGSVLALSTMVASSLVEKGHVDPFAVLLITLCVGTSLGLFMGYLIQEFEIPAFIVTLAGLYLARGLCYVISIDTIAIKDPVFTAIAGIRLGITDDASLTIGAAVALVLVLVAWGLSRYSKFGRTVFAIGGSEQSALLMGLPVHRTKILIYAFSGFCASAAGLVFTFYTLSGYALHGTGMELDTIASVVIGGSLLTGGVGSILGTVFGVLVYGSIQVLIMFQGTLNSWWTRIVIGLLVFAFCVLQRVFEARTKRT
jgi:ribose/xylose/arabinose/galactoside ABC-type transport system permease subunit